MKEACLYVDIDVWRVQKIRIERKENHESMGFIRGTGFRNC